MRPFSLQNGVNKEDECPYFSRLSEWRTESRDQHLGQRSCPAPNVRFVGSRFAKGCPPVATVAKGFFAWFCLKE